MVAPEADKSGRTTKALGRPDYNRSVFGVYLPPPPQVLESQFRGGGVVERVTTLAGAAVSDAASLG